MTIKPPRNIAASVRQKLLNVAKVRAADFQQICTQSVWNACFTASAFPSTGTALS